MRLPLILLIPGLLAAADPIAVRADGTGAEPGEAIVSGTAPTSFTLAQAPRARFRLPANATASVHVDAAGRAVVDLEAGTIEADVDERGPYPAIIVRGAAMEVRVTGTLFVVQRVRRDADYVALIQGRVVVGLRQEVLALLGRDVPDLTLTDRQGVGAGPAGFEAIDTLSSRPILGAAASIRDQALVPDPEGATWGAALSENPGLGDPASAIAETVANPGNPGNPGDPAGPVDPRPAVADQVAGQIAVEQVAAQTITEQVTTQTITEQVTTQVVEQVGEQITEQITDQVTEQVVDQVISPGLPPLGGPPPLP